MTRTTPRTTVKLLTAFALIALATAAASAQDFSHTYNLGPGGNVKISSVSGDVVVTGYDGNQVSVNAFKQGRDRDMVSIEDNSSGNTVDLRAKYPHNCDCNAGVRFEVMVPRSIELTVGPIDSASGDIKVSNFAGRVNLNTASGDLTLTNVSGEITANTASGDIKVEGASGSVKASTASGDVTARITSLEKIGDMRFNSSSGDVAVWVPNSIDAQVDMSTSSGSLTTDFPLQMSKDDIRSAIRSAHGMLGAGTHVLHIATASGDVSLKRL